MATKARDVGALRNGLTFKRHFTREGIHPFDEVTWETRDAVIPNFKDGGRLFGPQLEGEAADRARVIGDLVAAIPIAARHRLDERTLLVGDADCHAVDLVLDGVLPGGRVLGDLQRGRLRRVEEDIRP